MPRPRRTLTRRLSLTALQPVLTAIARRNARARELTATLRLPCSVCRAPLSTHFTARNRWIGCRKAGR